MQEAIEAIIHQREFFIQLMFVKSLMNTAVFVILFYQFLIELFKEYSIQLLRNNI